MPTVTLKIPFPPTANHIWARVGNRSFLTREYRRFLALVVGAVESAKVAPDFREAQAYAVELTVFPPDRRARSEGGARRRNALATVARRLARLSTLRNERRAR